MHNIISDIISDRSALFVAGFTCFAAFSWGIRGHFRSTGKIPPGMKLISTLSLFGFAAFSAHLAFGHPAGWWEFALALFALALGLFAWAIDSTRRTPPTLAFDDDKPSFLLRHGPYRYVRHPFYLSYILFWIGTALAFSSPVGWIIPFTMLAVYQHAASKEERKFAHSSLAADYNAYRTRAGMFLPKLTAS